MPLSLRMRARRGAPTLLTFPGCVATGASREEVERRIREAIPAHVALMRESGKPRHPRTCEGIIIVPAS
jgi:predicted RNase H-like HicB family nuclease